MFQAASISKPVAAMASLKAVQDGRFSLDQDVNTILKSWKLPERDVHQGASGHSTKPDEPHVGNRGCVRFPGYGVKAPLPSIPQILDGVQPPSNLRAVRLERAPMTGFEYSGGAVIDSAARLDRRRRTNRCTNSRANGSSIRLA